MSKRRIYWVVGIICFLFAALLFTYRLFLVPTSILSTTTETLSVFSVESVAGELIEIDQQFRPASTPADFPVHDERATVVDGPEFTVQGLAGNEFGRTKTRFGISIEGSALAQISIHTESTSGSLWSIDAAAKVSWNDDASRARVSLTVVIEDPIGKRHQSTPLIYTIDEQARVALEQRARPDNE